MKLYQTARTGKTKWISVDAVGAKLISQWGLADSDKVQSVEKVCTATNTGKANERTPEEQARFEADAKLTKLKKEGYLEWEDFEEDLESEEVVVTLDNLPEAFTPCKPISKAPAGVLKDPTTYGQRKHNGHCIILVKDDQGVNTVFSRRMENITATMVDIPPVASRLKSMSKGTMLLTEMVWADATGKEAPRKVAELVRVKGKEKATSRYTENSKLGTYTCIPFDAFWLDGLFIGHLNHTIRHSKLIAKGFDIPELYDDWRSVEKQARDEDWEGFILRTPDDRSSISYSLDGKAHREGSWKYKFVKEEDVVLVGATMGKSGKHADVYARFDIRQYNDAGELIHYGYCGTGTLKHDELKEMTRQIDAGELSFPIVVELEFQDRHYDSHFFEFPIIQRIRYDKTPEECIYNP
jgi:hypothetical protein